MNMKKCGTYEVKIYLAGSVQVAKQYLRERFFNNGNCCTISETEYLYTGGEEKGYILGFINYGRFPRTNDEIFNECELIAKELLFKTCQKSCSIVASDKTLYIEIKNKT